MLVQVSSGEFSLFLLLNIMSASVRLRHVISGYVRLCYVRSG
jgi:hypothetical protein